MYVWCGPWSATPEKIMKGMGLRPTPAATKVVVTKAVVTKATARTVPAAKTTATPPVRRRVLTSEARTAPKPRAKAPTSVPAKTRASAKPAPKPKRPAHAKRPLRPKTATTPEASS